MTTEKIDWGISKHLYLIVLGFLGFSMTGSYLLLKVFHLPFFLVELFFIPLIFRYWYPVFKTFLRRNSISLTFLIAMLLCSVVMALLNDLNFAVIIEYRSILYLILVFSYIKMNGIDLDLNDILLVSSCSVVSEFYFALVLNESVVATGMNMIGIAISIILSFILEKYFFGFIMFAFSLVGGIISSCRIGIVVSLVAFVTSVFYTIVRGDKTKNNTGTTKRLVFTSFLLLILIIGIYNYIPILNFLAEKLGLDEYTVFRVGERLVSFFKGDFNAAQENIRLNSNIKIVELFFESFFPTGIKTLQIPLYTDVPIIYLYDIFGSFVSWILCFSIVFKWMTKIPLIFKKYDTTVSIAKERFEILAVLTFPVLIVCFIINGSFISNVYQAILTGVLLGFLFGKNINENIEDRV